MGKSYDAIIIGAGVIGASVAFELAKKGRRTLNLDALPAAGYGSTSASCAIIRTHYSTLEGSALAYESYFTWRDWPGHVGIADERGQAEFFNNGVVVIKTEHNKYLGPICAIMDELGIPYEHWNTEKVSAKIPIYDLRKFSPVKRPNDEGFGEPTGSAIDGAVYFPHGGYVSDPQLATHNIQIAAEALGAAFRFNTEVAEIRRQGGRVAGVTLTGGEVVDAPVVVNVAGPHSSLVNRMAGVEAGMKIKTRALRQEVAHVPSPKGFNFEKKGYVISDSDIGCYSRPEVGNNILIGSEEPACDEKEWVDPDDYNSEFTEQWTAQVYRAAQRIPTLGIPGQARGVVALYDVSDDWIPIYDKSDLPGFYVAIGTSGNQFKNAPVAGAMMAALIEACEGGRDHDADPVQFELPNIGRTLDIGFFSRRREINPDSSFTVLG